MKRFTFILLLLILNSSFSAAQSNNFGITVSPNPMKPFLGLINFAVEIKLADHFAMYIGLEKEFREKTNHPDFLAKSGTRYYFSSKEEFLSRTFLGMNTAIARSKNRDDGDGFLLGTEIGYKLMLWKHVSSAPKSIIHLAAGDRIAAGVWLVCAAAGVEDLSEF